jgi:hypothetical protein
MISDGLMFLVYYKISQNLRDLMKLVSLFIHNLFFFFFAKLCAMSANAIYVNSSVYLDMF